MAVLYRVGGDDIWAGIMNHRDTEHTEKTALRNADPAGTRTGFLLLCALALCPLCLCGSFAFSAPPPVAIVNGEEIPRSELDAALAQRPPVVTPLTSAQDRELKEEVLQALIDERLIRQFLTKTMPPVAKEDIDRQVASLQRGLAAQNKPLDDYLKESRQT